MSVLLLIIPQQECLADVLATPTARALVARGASLYLLNNGTSVLAVKRPSGAFAKSVSLSLIDHDLEDAA